MLALKKIVYVLPLAVVTGCASIVSGKHQEITLNTTPEGASCNLNRKGELLASVPATPATVKVKKTKDDIEVSCAKNDFETANEHLDSGLDNWVFGNILAGGLIGWGIDSALGADNKYPEKVALTMQPKSAPLKQTMAVDTWKVGLPGIVQGDAAVAAPQGQSPK